MGTVKQAPKRYFVELIGAMLLYAAALVYRQGFAAAHPEPSVLKTIIVLSPIVPVCLAALAIYRFYQRMDEMMRRQLLEAIAIAAGFMAVVSIALGFLEDVGLPHLGLVWAWPLMGVGWLLVAAYRGIRGAVAEKGWGKTILVVLGTLLLVGVPTLAYALLAPGMGWPHQPGIIILFATAIFLAQQAYLLFVKRIHE